MDHTEEDTYDPFLIADPKETPEERLERRLREIQEEAYLFFDQRMCWQGVDALILYVQDVIEDYYTIIGECIKEEVELIDMRVSAVNVLKEILSNPGSDKELGLRAYLTTGRFQSIVDADRIESVMSSVSGMTPAEQKRHARVFAALAMLRYFQARSLRSGLSLQELAEQRTWLLEDGDLAVVRAVEIRGELNATKKLGLKSPEMRSEINVSNAHKLGAPSSSLVALQG